MKLWIAFFLPSFCLAWGGDPDPREPEFTISKALAKTLNEDQKSFQGQIIFPKFLVSGKKHWLSLIDGHVYSFGANFYGQLATGNGPESPNEIHSLPATSKILQVAAGHNHSMVLTQAGQVWGFGGNYFGQLGNDSLDSGFRPKIVLIKETVSSIYASGDLSLALTENGQVYVWGLLVQNPSEKEDRQIYKKPVLIPFSQKIKQALALPDYILAITRAGDLLIFSLSAKKEIKVMEGKNIFAMSLGEHPMVSSFDGQNWVLNDEFFEDLEMDDIKIDKYQLDRNIFAKQVAGFNEHYLILTKDGELLQIKFKNSLESMIKVPIKRVKEIGMGKQRAFAIDIHGKIWSWAITETALQPKEQLPVFPRPLSLPGRLNYFYLPFEKSRL